MNVLIIGLGSIAQKHIYVLKELVSNVKFYALRSSKDAREQEDVISIYSLDELDLFQFHFALVSSPSILHLKNIKELIKFDIPMMVEKPLFVDLDQIEQYELNIKKLKPFIYVACNFRFHPLIEYIKKYLKEYPSKINEVMSYCGSYLPDWRPNQDYRKVYSSIKNLGGGVHLDLVHEPDYMVYLFGKPNSTTSTHRKVSDLEINTYDSSNYLFQYDCFQAQVSLNYFRRDSKRTLEIVRENDTLLIDFIQGIIVNLIDNKVIFKNGDISIYTTYKKQMSYFLSCVKEKKTPMNSATEAIEILKCIL